MLGYIREAKEVRREREGKRKQRTKVGKDEDKLR